MLDKLPQRLQPRAKRALYEMMYAERAPARPPELASRRVSGQVPQGGGVAYCPLERLVTFFDFPAGHWKHLRTTNVIESPFATVRLRERATKGAGSITKGLLSVQAARHSAAALAPPRQR